MNTSIRVLHVDDDPRLPEVVAELLELEDDRIAVTTATSAEEGLDRLADADFDCVVSDYDMPGMDGIEFLEALRESHGSLPFVLFTGEGSEAVASDAISAGVTDYLQKGGGAEQYQLLAKRIVDAVDHRQARTNYREIFEKIPDGVVIHDADDGTLVDVNARYAEMFGYERPELLEAGFEAVLPDEEPYGLAEARRRVREAVECGPQTFEWPGVRKDGERFWTEVHLAPGRLDGDDRILAVVRDIADRKNQERELQRERDRLVTLFENLPNPVVHGVSGEEGPVVRRVNPAFEEVFGYDADAVEGRLLDEFIVPEGQREEAESLNRRIRGERNVQTEVRRQTATGPRTFRLDLAMRDLDAGGTEGYAIYTDVTERIERERELQVRSTAMEASIDGMAILDEDGEYVFVNRAHADVYGYDDPSAFLGRSWRTCYDDETLARMEEEVVPTLFAEGSWRGEAVGTRRDGSTFPQELSLTALDDGGMICVVRDITERRRYERVVTALHDVADDLADSDTVDAVCRRTIDAAEELLDFDRSVLALEDDGYLEVRAASGKLSPGDYRGMGTDEGIAGKTYRTGRGVLVDDLTDHEEARPQGPFRSLISLPVGDHGNFQAAAGPTGAFDRQDLELARLLVTHTESVLDRLARERELKRQNDRLEAFANVVSHDLRNPLEVAAAGVELARTDCDSPHLDRVEGALDRMDAIVDDVLTLARQGQRIDELESVAVSSVSARSWRVIDAGEATLEVETDLALRADPDRLQRLLENLFRNSVEHGGRQVTVRVGRLEDAAGFYVADDGVGIPPEDRSRVFESGYSTTREGTGFGLAIVEGIADAHGWSVDVTNGPDGGVRFEITGVDPEG